MPPITLHFSEPLIRAAARAYWWRALGWSFLLTLALLVVSLAFLVWTGDRSWLVGVCGTVLGFGIVFAGLLYFVRSGAALARLRRMRIPEVTLHLGEERFRLVSDLGTTELPWSAVTELWQLPGLWLLFVAKAQFLTFPAADLDPASRAFISAGLTSCPTRTG